MLFALIIYIYHVTIYLALNTSMRVNWLPTLMITTGLLITICGGKNDRQSTLDYLFLITVLKNTQNTYYNIVTLAVSFG